MEVKEVMFSKAVKVYVQKDIVKLSIKASDSHVITHTFDTEYFTSEVLNKLDEISKTTFLYGTN